MKKLFAALIMLCLVVLLLSGCPAPKKKEEQKTAEIIPIPPPLPEEQKPQTGSVEDTPKKPLPGKTESEKSDDQILQELGVGTSDGFEQSIEDIETVRQLGAD